MTAQTTAGRLRPVHHTIDFGPLLLLRYRPGVAGHTARIVHLTLVPAGGADAITALCGALLHSDQVELDVPATVISNSSRQVRSFVNGSRAVVRKLFSPHLFDDAGRSLVGHTRLISDEDLIDVDHVALTAHQVQSYVDKLMDVRVVVVGKRTFPVAIHPLSEAARVDFRADYRALRHEIIELPDDVQEGICRFMRESGLLMASMDFSVGRDGRYYFLESNPAGGQYGWLGAKTGVRITEAVADLLAEDWSAVE